MLGIPEIAHSLIIIGGKGPCGFDMPKREYSRIIAADSGLDTALSLGIRPDLVVGDFDSVSNKDLIQQFECIASPKDKDESDFELALMQIDGPYDLIGGGEGRMDHLLSIFMLFEGYGLPRFWFTKEDVLVGVNSGISINLPIDSTISVFALEEALVESEGLLWELGGRRLDHRFMSLSNRNRSHEVRLRTNAPIFVRLEPEVFAKSQLRWPSLVEI